MKQKTVLIAAVTFCILSMLMACNKTKITGTDTPYLDTGSLSKSVGDNFAADEPTIRQIVFHNTIDDPQADYLNSLDGGGSNTTGRAKLDLVLCETEPDVYEGCGTMYRNIDIMAEEVCSEQEYSYRTGLIRAESGKEGTLTLTGCVTENRDTETLLPDAPFRLLIHKNGTLQQKDLPVMLTIDGNQATLSIKMHDHAEFVFSGEISSKTAEVSKSKSLDAESLIYINSLWCSSFSGGTDNKVYTAILLASPISGQNNYSGQLYIQVTANEIVNFDESVTFAFQPFNNVTYHQAGGQMQDEFDFMSVLPITDSTYILLLEGETIFLESAGAGIYFCGSMRSGLEWATLKNEADKTKTMLSYLSRQESSIEDELPDHSGLMGLDPSNLEDMKKLIEMAETLDNSMASSNAPAWYPQGLIPMIHYSEENGFNTIPIEKELFFRIYYTGYSEEENFEDLIEPYRAFLSGYDAYNEFLNYEKAEGVFVFTMGRYTLQVLLSQSVIKMTNVSVQIF